MGVVGDPWNKSLVDVKLSLDFGDGCNTFHLIDAHDVQIKYSDR